MTFSMFDEPISPLEGEEEEEREATLPEEQDAEPLCAVCNENVVEEEGDVCEDCADMIECDQEDDSGLEEEEEEE